MADMRLRLKRGRGFLFSGLLATILAVSVLSGSGKKTEGVQVTKPAGQLIAVERLPLVDGQMCEVMPSSAGGSLFELAALQQTPAATAGAASSAAQTAVALRRPVRILKDAYPSYSAVAVDVAHNEVILAAENNLSLMVHDRLQNTPPNVFSEPKRIIHGTNTELEYVCGVYVDPNTGDIYGINNDTLNKLTVFPRQATGNAVPARALEVPQGTFGIAVDEKSQELMLTVEDDSAVVSFRKMAKDKEAPIRVLQGEHTLLANPHGITHDSRNDLIYVTNWGVGGKMVPRPTSGPIEGTTGRGFGKTLWPMGRNYYIPGTGEFRPPSITVYARTAQFDAPPLRVIQGPKTQLNWPTALAMDPDRGELYVANDTTDSILVFKADANGDVAPIRVLKGPKTLIKNPIGVAVDLKNQEFWATSVGNHTATVFKIGASGDVPPLRVIRGAPANVETPTFINSRLAFDSKRDELLVAS
jgi:DNA-binding beta-propeller fold protein YncE